MAQKEWVKQIFQIVSVVDNVEETLENWKRDVEFDHNSISCGTTDVAKYAEFDFGGVVMKLVEPFDKEGDDVYARTLREKGQGFHHIGLVSDNYEELINHFESLGFKPVSEEIVDDRKEVIFNFEKEIGMSVGAYEEMYGPCAR